MATCQYCGSEVSQSGKEAHESVCSHNPEVESDLNPGGSEDIEEVWKCKLCETYKDTKQKIAAHAHSSHEDSEAVTKIPVEAAPKDWDKDDESSSSSASEVQVAEPVNEEASRPVETKVTEKDEQMAVEAGSHIGEILGKSVTGSEVDRELADGALMKGIGAVALQMGEHVISEEIKERQNAKEVSSDEIEKVETNTSCPECGVALAKVPESGEEFRCGRCGELLIRN